jgi:hypothetical protein
MNGRFSGQQNNKGFYYLRFTIHHLLIRTMSAKLSVIFYIILCLEIGIVLALLPWIPQGTLGLSDWGNNYFLLYAARKTGMHALQAVVASGWMRGAVTGVGLLNIGIAFWEIFHFKQTVQALQEGSEPRSSSKKDGAEATKATNATAATEAATPTPVSHHERRDDRPNHAGN